ncbi:MAG: DUF1592 domain-containing protein [Sandaracinaceae bacterium]
MQRAAPLLAAALAVSGCHGVIDAIGRPGTPAPVETGSGIALRPPAGTGERALMCEADHAPLRRMNHTEYRNTVRDLFAGYTVDPPVVSPDARRGGFTNNYEVLSPSSQMVRERYEAATRLVAQVADPMIADLACANDAACFERFVREFGERAYRRPLTDEEVAEHTAYFASGPAQGDFHLAVEMSLLMFLQSPGFLYRPELGDPEGKLTQFEIASRLSYFLWASMPDGALLDAARGGDLSGPGLETQVTRMLADPRAREGLLSATSEWLELDRLETRLKGEGFLWSADIRRDLRESVDLFLWNQVFAEGGSLEALMNSHGAYVNDTIGPIFGVDDAGPELAWRELPDRAGLLTHPAILATYAHGTYGSPVLRGVFILTEILCDAPSPPPPGASMGVPPTEDATGAPLTNRGGYEELTQSSPDCAACHDQINPFGFAFEHYDTVGAYQDTDHGYSIDATGTSRGFTLRDRYEFDGADDLTEQLAQSSRVRACVVDRWVRYATGGGALAYDPCLREEIEAIATRPGARLLDVILAIAVHPKFADAEIVE